MLQRVADGLFGLAHFALNLAFGLIELAVGLKFGVAGDLTGGIFNRTARLLGRAFNLILVHSGTSLRCFVEETRGTANGSPRNIKSAIPIG